MRRVIVVVLGLLVCGMVWIFWPRGQQVAPVAKLPAPVTTVAAVSPLAPAAAPGMSATNHVPGRSVASTNRELYRLANTSKPVGQLTGMPHAILLENAFVDTDAKLSLNIPSQLRAGANPGAYIVQARTVITPAFRAALAGAGGQIISYIPNNAYLVQLSSAAAGTLAGNPLVQAVLPYEPYYKVQASLLGLAVQQDPLPTGQVLTLGLYASGASATVAQIERLGGKVIATDRSPFGPVVRVTPPADWLALAQLPGVFRLEPATHRELANDLARVTMGISPDTVTNANWLGLNGSNVVVEVNDTGVDAGHPDFSFFGSAEAPGSVPPSRVSGYYPSSLVDVNGHGTHVAGIIAGNGSESYTVTNIPQGSVTNADFRGKAPAASLFSFGFLGANDTNIYVSDYELQSIPALTNALISNNSWGNGGDNEYDLSAASYDAAVRDALPETTGPQPVLFVFAAGNAGGGDDSGFNGNADTIRSPATAKNVITVGALEQYRNITNTYIPLGSTNEVLGWAGQTSSSDQVAAYSSRGNVGVQTEGTYGRFKPDVVAPGTFVLSTRPSMWDMEAYYNPTNVRVSAQAGYVDSSTTLGGTVSVPINATAVNILIETNQNNPTFVPTNLPIYISLNGAAGPGNYDLVGYGSVSIPPMSGGNISGIGSLQNSGFNYTVVDNTNFPVSLTVVVQVLTTNDNGNALVVLSNLNETIGPWYYYNSGTSMAAPAVSGSLALMQQFLQSGVNAAFPTNPSPALLKAMLINGARLTGPYTGYALTNGVNYEGWGLVNVPNSIPMGLTNPPSGASNTTPMFVLDQSPTNALATGDSRTYLVDVPTFDSQVNPLHITLAWTDPPGNPAASIKLVNNLDLIVTNLDTGDVYYGNYFQPDSIYSAILDTNSVPLPDSVNNVENVVLEPLLWEHYSVTVFARNVAVNAVTTEQTNVVQDFSLVISSGDGYNTNGFTITAATPPAPTVTMPQVTYITSYTNGILFDQLAGASAPWLSTNDIAFGSGSDFSTNAALFIGQTNQWHFYVITNTTTFSNAAFITFLPNTQATPRMGVFEDTTANSTRPEADLNLFVASPQGTPSGDANAGLLTNLDYTVISNCVFNVNGDQASLSRGGTKFIAYSNSVQGQVYYIGVQCQDQMAAQYGFLGVFSQNPFSTLNPDGSQTVNGVLLPAPIPDGSNTKAGVAYVIGLALYPMEIGDLTVTNVIFHQNFGDLVGSLTHGTAGVVLNNHDGLGDGTFTLAYNDNGLPGTRKADGPGSLKNFIKQEAAGPWIMTQVDDSQGQTGTITGFTMNIQPHKSLTDGLIVVSVPAHSWWYGYVDVPVGNTNLLVVATNLPPTSVPPIEMYLNQHTEPDFTNYLVRADLTNGVPPGNSISYGPPLTPDTYWVGLYNPDSISHDVLIGAFLSFDASAITRQNFVSAGPVPLLDDAVSYDYINVDATNTVQDFSVGLRVDHPRISDLVFTLIRPDGTRYLLMENRGGQSTNGCGVTVVSTNIVNVPSSGGAAAQTNYINVGSTSGTLPISYNFYTLPDQMTVYYGTNAANFTPSSPYAITNTGMVSGSNTFTIAFPPAGVTADSTYVTIIMNQFSNSAPTTLWNYTAGGVQTNFYYLTFTEDTNLTTTPIKYAVPPFTPVPATNFVAYTNFPGYTNWSVNNHWYKAVVNDPNDPLDWDQADQIAHAAGGHLATITNSAENDFVFSLINDPKYFMGNYGNGSGPAIGGIKTNTASAANADWTWETGEPWSFTAWNTAYGQPDFANETRLQYWSGTQGVPTNVWNNLQPTDNNLGGYVIEIEPHTNAVVSAGDLYYQPEDDISGVQGINPQGVWTLEILDNRAGATNNANLLSWTLNFTFANTNIPQTISTNLGGTNYLAGGATQWFQIFVPTNADWATNTLLFATLPLQLWWSTNEPPTLTNTTDVQLLVNSTGGSSVLGTNTTPAFITPGGYYYLGVQNTNVGGAYYALDVFFHYLAVAPTVKTLPATNLDLTSATLQASVQPGYTAATVYFEYGTTTNLGSTSASFDITNNFNFTQVIGIGVTNLTPNTTYYFRAVATNSVGTNYGNILSFFTTPVPYAQTLPATLVNGTNAQLNGFATPNASTLPTAAWFEWGTNTTYGNLTPAVSVPNGFTVVYTNALITNLLANVAYHFRLVVSNSQAVTYGFDQMLDEANVVAWGANFLGQTTVPAGLSNVVAVAAAYDHSLALKTDGTAVGWGENSVGQATVPANYNSNLVALAGGEYFSAALRANGTVVAWGANLLPNQTNVPATLNNVVAIAAGRFASLALNQNGLVTSWGVNFSGLTNVPAGVTNVVSVAGGSLHSLALINNGTVAAWGDNSYGQTNIPTGLNQVVAIAAGSLHSLALKANGTVVAWGDNSDGQTNVPTGLTNVVAIAAGGFHSVALKSDGTLVTWGDNSAGQTSVPVGLTNVVAISGGNLHNLALTPQSLSSLTNAFVFSLTNGVAVTNTLAAGATTYYEVDVPTNADLATNTLFSSVQGVLNVWFTTNSPPSLAAANFLFSGATNGVPVSSVLSTTSVPTNIVPGGIYYLGVQNTNNFAVTYAIGVDFHLASTNPPVFTNAISIASIVYTNISGTNGFLLTWFAPSNYLFQVQWSDSLSPVNWQTFTNPTYVSYNPNYPASATNATFTFFDDGSQSGGLSSMRFYRLLVLASSANTAPVFNLGPAVTRYVTPTYTLTVTNAATDTDLPAQTLTYSLLSAPTGVTITTNGVITWTNVPVALAGTTNLITTVVTDNGTPPLSATNTITVLVNPLATISSVTYGTNGTTLQWTGWTNEQFQVQWATNLVSPVTWTLFPGTITSTNGTFTFVDTNTTLLMKFYQLILLP